MAGMLLSQLQWPRNTSRLSVRIARAQDAAEVWSWQSDPRVSEWMPRRATDQAVFVAGFIQNLQQTLVASHGDQIVASAKLALQNCWAQDEIAEQAANTEAEIGWALDPQFQGQGLGTELAAELLAVCFEELGLHRVVAVCFAANVASARIMEKVGMRREAHFRGDSLHRSGEWCDSFSYAMLDAEWKSAKTGLTSGS